MPWSMFEAPWYSILLLVVPPRPIYLWLALLLHVAYYSGSAAWPSNSHEYSVKVGWIPLSKAKTGLLAGTIFL